MSVANTTAGEAAERRLVLVMGAVVSSTIIDPTYSLAACACT